MKKSFVLLFALVLVFALPACAEVSGEHANYRRQVKQSNAEVRYLSETSVTDNNSATVNELISRDSAINIALAQAGLTIDSVYDLEAELDREFHGIYWEVDFETRQYEYSYDINAENGEIAKQNREFND